MKPIAKTSLAIAALSLCLPLAALHAQTKAGWSDNQPQALIQAKTGKKLVLMDFTGSDWCGWCMKMDKEVFDTAEFKQYAKDNVVLVEVDFPKKQYLPAATVAQNDLLQKKYGVQSFPTLVVLDGDGKMLKTFGGYQQGGAAAFIAELQKLKS